MSKFIFKIAIILTCFTAAIGARAQMMEDPATWTYEVKKLAAGEYELVFHLTLQDGWHIWSLQPGGDGFQIPPSFTFVQNADFNTDGPTLEKGKKITEMMDGIDGEVNYFSGQVDFIQKVKTMAQSSITGTHEYQVCNDRLCLPPKTKKFTFVVGD